MRPPSPIPILMSMASKRTASTIKSTTVTKHGLMMILSPAKTLNLDAWPLTITNDNKNDQEEEMMRSFTTTSPSCNVDKTKELVLILKQKKKKDLKSMLSISDKLTDSVFQYYQDFEVQPSSQTKNIKIPACFAFDGPAYKGLNIQETCFHHPQTLPYLQDNLIILDALYGCLFAMDNIQPYRLEMGTKGIIKDLNKNKKEYKTLAKYWGESITQTISKSLESRPESNRYLINLASDEYSSSVEITNLPPNTTYLKVIFQQEGKVIAVHAKRARGSMVRYIAMNQICDVEKVKEFDLDGYTFVDHKSDVSTFVFDRLKPDKNNTKSESKSKPKAKVAKTKSTASKRKAASTDTAKDDDHSSSPQNNTKRRSTRSTSRKTRNKDESEK